MKRYILIFFILVFSFAICLADDKDIDDIKATYNKLKQSHPGLKKITKDLMGYSTEGGEAVYYKDTKGEILIIEIDFYGESGKAREEYYYKNKALIFMLRTKERYNAPINTLTMSDEDLKEYGMERLDHKKSVFEESRFYFKDNKMIQWLFKKGKRNAVADRSEWEKEEYKILDFSNEIFNMLKS